MKEIKILFFYFQYLPLSQCDLETSGVLMNGSSFCPHTRVTISGCCGVAEFNSVVAGDPVGPLTTTLEFGSLWKRNADASWHIVTHSHNSTRLSNMSIEHVTILQLFYKHYYQCMYSILENCIPVNHATSPAWKLSNLKRCHGYVSNELDTNCILCSLSYSVTQ